MSRIAEPELSFSPPSLAPLDWREFAVLVEDLGASFPLTLAVSGGGDSMGLAVLAARWAAAASWSPPPGLYPDMPPVTALSVDHGLRPESAAELEWVGEQLAGLGIMHAVLRWEGPRPTCNLQAEAREARYGLMERWCRENGRPTLLTAHTIEDQAETLMLRLSRGSGVDGLAAMSPRVVLTDGLRRPSVALLRPLLGISRSRLRATCTLARQKWLEDPFNDDPRFARVRMRKLADMLAREGLTPERLAATAAGFARVREALDTASAALSKASVTFHEAGYVVLEGDMLARAPREVGLRTLAKVLQMVGGQVYRPRFKRLESVYEGICGGRAEKARTLARCRIAPLSDPYSIMICRENRHSGLSVRLGPGEAALWDGRFRVSLPADVPGGEVRALGAGGFRLIRDAGSQPCASVPQAVRPSLPALWRGEALVAAPHAGFDPGQSGFRAVFLREPDERDALTSSCEN